MDAKSADLPVPLPDCSQAPEVAQPNRRIVVDLYSLTIRTGRRVAFVGQHERVPKPAGHVCDDDILAWDRKPQGINNSQTQLLACRPAIAACAEEIDELSAFSSKHSRGHYCRLRFTTTILKFNRSKCLLAHCASVTGRKCGHQDSIADPCPTAAVPSDVNAVAGKVEFRFGSVGVHIYAVHRGSLSGSAIRSHDICRSRKDHLEAYLGRCFFET